MISTHDNGYAWCAEEVNAFNGGDALVVRFNNLGDTLWTARFGSSDYDGAFALVQLPDSGFAVFGTTDSTDRDPFIWRLDKSGNTLWTSILGTSGIESCWSGTRTQDGGFVLSGTKRINNNRTDVYLVKTDSAGNFLWNNTYGSLFRDNASFVTELTNGSLLLATGIGQVAAPADYKQSALILTDPMGDELWSEVYPDSQWTTLFSMPLELANGDIVVVGGRIETVNKGSLFKMDSNGTKIWERHFYNTLQRNQYLYDVQRTNDGGFIMAGQAFDTLVVSQDAWLVKVDSFGCIVPGCQNVGITEQVTDLGDVLDIFPNPVAVGTALELNITLPPDYLSKELRLTVLDAMGRVIHEQVTTGTNPHITTFDWSAGIHYIHLSDGLRWLSGEKVVVE